MTPSGQVCSNVRMIGQIAWDWRCRRLEGDLVRGLKLAKWKSTSATQNYVLIANTWGYLAIKVKWETEESSCNLHATENGCRLNRCRQRKARHFQREAERQKNLLENSQWGRASGRVKQTQLWVSSILIHQFNLRLNLSISEFKLRPRSKVYQSIAIYNLYLFLVKKPLRKWQCMINLLKTNSWM